MCLVQHCPQFNRHTTFHCFHSLYHYNKKCKWACYTTNLICAYFILVLSCTARGKRTMNKQWIQFKTKTSFCPLLLTKPIIKIRWEKTVAGNNKWEYLHSAISWNPGVTFKWKVDVPVQGWARVTWELLRHSTYKT
jgi:hypothetical protein